MKLSKILTPKDMDSLTDQCLQYIGSIQHQDSRYDLVDKLSKNEPNNTQAIMQIREILTELNIKGDSK